MVPVPEPLGVLEDFIGGRCERERLFKLIPEAESELQVLLQVLEWEMCGKTSVDYRTAFLDYDGAAQGCQGDNLTTQFFITR